MSVIVFFYCQFYWLRDALIGKYFHFTRAARWLCLCNVVSSYSPLMVTLRSDYHTYRTSSVIVHAVKFWQIFPHSIELPFYPILCLKMLCGVFSLARKMLSSSFFFMTYYFHRIYHFASSWERWRFAQKFCGWERNRKVEQRWIE